MLPAALDEALTASKADADESSKQKSLTADLLEEAAQELKKAAAAFVSLVACYEQDSANDALAQQLLVRNLVSLQQSHDERRASVTELILLATAEQAMIVDKLSECELLVDRTREHVRATAELLESRLLFAVLSTKRRVTNAVEAHDDVLEHTPRFAVSQGKVVEQAVDALEELVAYLRLVSDVPGLRTAARTHLASTFSRFARAYTDGCLHRAEGFLRRASGKAGAVWSASVVRRNCRRDGRRARCCSA